ncbi:MEDS domain-containing protein [Fictibacillus nanhaiensis]|uniref:MEDS domain-containing protein n=1 Tax=Fictibacillus nanhaiensis TaxID=742169 RepID=UPI001C940775|nr:MEDS domain-containing protein [Fictibacillus nanhaiensis]MBY6036430.1 MEDS domain-containing protein [Fictibacillus nanhaiensis]
MQTKINQLLKNQKNAHLFYSYRGMQNYIRNTVAYILAGIKAGDSIILIENERMLPHLLRELKKYLTKNEMDKIHRINNFDFYFSSGSYHPPAIFEHINNTIKPYRENNITFRTWTHVEWSTIDGPLAIVEELERGVDQLVSDLNLVVMCAYEEERMPESLRLTLLRTHKFILTDDDILISEQYIEKVEN